MIIKLMTITYHDININLYHSFQSKAKQKTTKQTPTKPPRPDHQNIQRKIMSMTCNQHLQIEQLIIQRQQVDITLTFYLYTIH